MSFDSHANLANSAIATPPSPADSGTSLTVEAGTGEWFTLSGPPPFNATVWPQNTIPTPANSEIVRVTEVDGDEFTIIRATDTEPSPIGPIAITAGMQIANSVSAKVLIDAEQAVRSSPAVVQFVAAAVNWNADTTVTLTDAPTVGNLLVAIFGADNNRGDLAIGWTTPGSGWYDLGGGGIVGNLQRWIEWGVRAVAGGDSTTIDLGTFGDGGVSSNDATVVVYEVSGADMSSLPTSPVAGSNFATDPGNSSGFPTDAVNVPGGGLAIAAAYYTGGTPTVGGAASPVPGSLDYLGGLGLEQLATYSASAAGLSSAVGEIAFVPYNDQQTGFVEFLGVLQGVQLVPGTVAAVVAGTGISVSDTDPARPVVSATGVLAVVAGTDIAVDATNPARPVVSATGIVGDSRLDLAMLTSGSPLPAGEFIIVGVDTDVWTPYSSGGGNYTAGDDISLNEDGATIDIATAGTYLVRLAFQYTPYQGSTQVRFASGDSAHLGNFPGWLSGDPDPLTIAVAPGLNGDYIGNYMWRIAAGGSFTIALGCWGNTADESLDGAEISIVRIA